MFAFQLLMCGTGSYSIADFKANHALSGATYEFRRVFSHFIHYAFNVIDSIPLCSLIICINCFFNVCYIYFKNLSCLTLVHNLIFFIYPFYIFHFNLINLFKFIMIKESF